MHLPRSVARRVYLTLLALAVTLVGYHIPVPGIDPVPWRLYSPERFGYPKSITLFSAGIGTYIVAAILVLLLSGLIPALRKMRDGDPGQKGTFDGLILAVTAVLGLTKGVGFSLFAAQLQVPGSGNAGGQPILVVLTVVAGALALAWLAIFITRYGIGNGVAVIYAASLVRNIPDDVLTMLRDMLQRDRGGLLYLLTGVVIVATVVACIAVLRGRREIALERVGGESDPAPAEARPPVLRVPFNPVGIMPFDGVATLTAISVTLGIVGFRIPSVLRPDSISPVRLLVELVIIVFMTYLLIAWIYNSRNTAGILERFGYRPAGSASPAAVVPMMDATLESLALPFAFFLFLLAVLPHLLVHLLGVKYAMAQFAGFPALVLSAVVMDIRQQLSSLVALAPDRGEALEGEALEEKASSATGELLKAGDEADTGSHDGDDPWTPVAAFDTELEAELLLAELSRASIQGIIHANRWMSMLGTLSLWGPCRPTYPALAPHRRLGGGEVTVYVPKRDLARAQEILPPAL